MINLLPLRLMFIRTYERDSDKERLREDVLPRFRVLKCCDFLWTVFLRAFSFFALTLVAMLPESKWLSKVVFNIGVLCISIDVESQSLKTLLVKFLNLCQWIEIRWLHYYCLYHLYLRLKYWPKSKMCHPLYLLMYSSLPIDALQ